MGDTFQFVICTYISDTARLSFRLTELQLMPHIPKENCVTWKTARLNDRCETRFYDRCVMPRLPHARHWGQVPRVEAKMKESPPALEERTTERGLSWEAKPTLMAPILA